MDFGITDCRALSTQSLASELAGSGRGPVPIACVLGGLVGMLSPTCNVSDFLFFPLDLLVVFTVDV